VLLPANCLVGLAGTWLAVICPAIGEICRVNFISLRPESARSAGMMPVPAVAG
jgi:hypothetical protein